METSRTNAQYKRNDIYNFLYEMNEFYLSYEFFSYDRHDRYDHMETRLNETITTEWILNKFNCTAFYRQQEYTNDTNTPLLQSFKKLEDVFTCNLLVRVT